MNNRRRIAVLTGTRAEFGLLRTVMLAIGAHDSLKLQTIVTGAHLLPPDHTIREVEAEFPIDCRFEMQRPGEGGRASDVAAVARGMAALAEQLPQLDPDVLLVLGDRIEAFTGAAAASILGNRVAHLHGGDRAQGVADEAMRHAITKLAHIHLPATPTSARRIERMGEPAQRIHVVGSPAIDDLSDMPALDDETFGQLGGPELLVMMHPTGRSDDTEAADMQLILSQCARAGRVLVLDPNHDAGRDGIIKAIDASGLPRRSHLPRREFVGLLRRVQALIGNSSAGLIEAAALGTATVNVGLRQDGRERPSTVIDVLQVNADALNGAISEALQRGRAVPDHQYGDGTTGRRVAELLATYDPAQYPITKRNDY